MVINTLSKFLSEGYKITYAFDAKNLSEAEKLNIINDVDTTITDIDDYFILTNDKHRVYYLEDIIYNSIIQKEDKCLLNMNELMEEIKKEYPNFFNITPEAVNNVIKKGYKYIFTPEGSDSIPPEQRSVDFAKYEILHDVGLDGIVSNGGFLDLSDTLFDCLIFNDKGEEVDLKSLKEAYLNRWKQ